MKKEVKTKEIQILEKMILDLEVEIKYSPDEYRKEYLRIQQKTLKEVIDIFN